MPTQKPNSIDKTQTLKQILATFIRGSEEIKRIRASIEELKTQNSQIVRTLKDIHAVLAAINSQAAEQRMEMWELRKRMTDLQEDAMGTFAKDNAHEEDDLGSSYSEYYEDSELDDQERFQPICTQGAFRKSSQTNNQQFVQNTRKN